MNRTVFMVAGVLSAPSLLLLDSAVKSTALLMLAAIAVICLRRDSAATRHLVWQLAIVAMLAVPVLSAMLPQWRVLPEWATIPTARASVATSLPAPTRPTMVPDEVPQASDLDDVESPSTSFEQAATLPVALRSTLDASEATPALATWSWLNVAPFVWGLGCGVLLLRLLAARWILWNVERRGTVIGASMPAAKGIDDPLVVELKAALLQLGMSYPVILITHPDNAIPVVWGILRYRLRLPVAARQWSGEQLRSVLLHELAHLKRRDTLAQLLTQVACAVHWFNPLMWFAAWRLGVERERACDDLVLASGVKPSAYAGHLLDVVTGLAPARWTQSCGLAMARQSSLEGRLIAVLSTRLNRRGVPVALAAIALTIAVGVAVPIAMLRAAEEKLAASESPAKVDLKPKHEYAQSLFRKWQANARTDGKIPGALIGHVAREIDSFLKQYPQDEKVAKLAALRPRLDAGHDWTQADVVTLLDDITAISTAPVSWADLPLEFDEMRNLKPGLPLPAGLQAVAWGTPADNGLRAAWLLEPQADHYPLGTVLKARVLFHNTGKAPVIFSTETWHQYDPHQAYDAIGTEIKVSGISYTGITPMATYRLAPGEYCEVVGHGIAIGAGKYEEELSIGSVGAIIEAKEGDAVRLSHSVDTTYAGWTRPDDPKNPAELRKKAIAERVGREAPMPRSAADRELLIRRVTLDIFGVPPSAEEVAEFVADDAPDALGKLTARLQAKPRIEPYSGKLPTGETRFRVTAADPDAARKPRTANGPGRYVLGDGVHLLVSQRTADNLRTNSARIVFLSPDPKVASPHQPYEIVLPDGLLTWAIAWERGAGVLWVIQKGLVRKYDFTNPAQVTETRSQPGSIVDIPEQFHEALNGALDVPGAPVQQRKSLKGQEGGRLKPATEHKLKWGEPANGLRMALAWPPTLGEPAMGDADEFYLAVQNVSPAAIRLTANDAAPNPRRLMMRDNGSPLSAISDPLPMPGDWLLQPREVAFLRLFQASQKTKDGRTVCAVIEQDIRVFPQYSMTAEMTIAKAPAGAWTGKLATAETRGSVDVIPPKHTAAQALYKSWTTVARADGKIPGGVIALLGESVKTFIKYNPTWETTPRLEKMLPRFDASRDWTGPDAVALLDELAAVQDSPIQMALDHEAERTIRTGMPLPQNLADAPWGEALPNGLRLAWLLEPRAAEYRLNTPLKSRILIHNAGKVAVAFRTRTWHQSAAHKATDAKGAEIKIESTSWTTRGLLVPFRLAPGEFVEVIAAGIGVGANKDNEDWQNTRVGSWIDAKEGDDVTFKPAVVPLSDWNEEAPQGGEPRWWLDFIKARLARHLPFPADAEARKLVLYRIAMELFGTPVSAEINAAFVADREPTALDSLAERLFHRPGLHAWAGPMTSGPTKFRVLPVDPDAAKRPRVASNPGRYTLGENIRLVVSRRPVGQRLVNEASIEFYSSDPKADPPGKPVAVQLPDGYGTWAAAWVRGGTILWVQQTSGIRSYDFTLPAEVKEATLDEPAEVEKVPRPILDALRAALDALGASKPAVATPKPAAESPK